MRKTTFLSSNFVETLERYASKHMTPSQIPTMESPHNLPCNKVMTKKRNV